MISKFETINEEKRKTEANSIEITTFLKQNGFKKIEVLNNGLYYSCSNCKTVVPLWQEHCPLCKKVLNWEGFIYE